MTRKINWPILLTVACVILFAGVLWYGFKSGIFSFSLSKKSNQTIEKEEEIKVNRTDYTDVARKTLDWIDKQRNADGWYILERGCDLEKKTCDTIWDNKEGNKDGLIATWARLNFYEQHKEAKDLEIVKKDIDIFYDKYKNDNLKDSLWICKITYEMAQSKNLDQGQKDKLKNLCLNVKYLTPSQIISVFENGVNDGNQNKDPTKKWSDYITTLRGFDNNLSITTELVYQYLFTKDTNKLDLAKNNWLSIYEYFEKDRLSRKPEVRFMRKIKYTDDVCLLGLSGLDLYRQIGDEKILFEVLSIYENTVEIPGFEGDFLVPLCGLWSKQLFGQTKDKKFLKNLEINNSDLISTLNDKNNNGFYISSQANRFVPNKRVVENSLIVEMIRN